MVKHKKFVFIVFLCVSLPNFCMDADHQQMMRVDDPACTLLKKWQDVAEFAGKVVAIKSSKPDLKDLYTIGAHDLTYGLISAAPKIIGAATSGYNLYRCKKTEPWSWETPQCKELSNELLQQESFSMRSLTFHEAEHLADAIQKKKLVCWNSEACSVLPQEDWSFRIRDLHPKEQRRYLRDNLKNVLMFRLGRLDSNSPLNRFPKEIINLIARHVIESEMQCGEMEVVAVRMPKEFWHCLFQ